MARSVQTALAVCLLLAFAVGGCASSTFTQNPHERKRQHQRIADHDRRGLQEDLDLLFMNERNSRLTRWHDR